MQFILNYVAKAPKFISFESEIANSAHREREIARYLSLFLSSAAAAAAKRFLFQVKIFRLIGLNTIGMAEKLAPDKSHSYIHHGQKVFDWDQTLEEVNMYIELPPNVPKKLFNCKIDSKHVEVGIKGNPPYLNHELTYPVKTDCSFWTLEDNTMHITLQKRDKGQTWSSPIMGQAQLDPYTADLEQRRLMLQRFQEENPGFDFSQAQFNGNCPDPRTFMGGIRSD